MQPGQIGLDQLKQRMRATWMAGDFGQIAKLGEKEAETFVGRLGIEAGAHVLDVACGTGNLAIPAARAGARVKGIDIAPNLVMQARQRAAVEDVQATFEEGDAEQLPYEDGRFDVVMTMFGAMFAPRPEVVAAELVRVCRPKGTIAMANWTPEGFVGKVFALGAKFAPPPPGVPPPVLWGKEDVAKERLASGTSEVRTTRRITVFNYPFSPAEVVQFFRNYFGPTNVAFSKLDAQGQADYASQMEKLWRDHNEANTESETRVSAEYLEVIAIRA